MNAPPPAPMSGLLSALSLRADRHRAETSEAHKADWGQFFTPPEIAGFLAGWLDPCAGRAVTILDPGAGAGMLGIAAAEVAFARGAAAVRLFAVEAEPGTLPLLRGALDLAQQHLDPRLQTTLIAGDFLSLDRIALPEIDLAISNPPYFKLSPSDLRGGDAPNAYARFMEVAAATLRPGGQLLFVVPRSFASGHYFQRFRRRFHAVMSLERAHLFGSRRAAFAQDEVLQESVLVGYRRGALTGPIQISASAGLRDLGASRITGVDRAVVLPDDPAGVVWLPTGPEDLATLAAVRGWPARLAGLGLEVSTGPVVPFRTEALRERGGPGTAPLLWMQHVRPGEIRWPLAGFRKPQHLDLRASRDLLLPDRTCVVVRRFSAKEEARRLTAAVLEQGALPGGWIGLENHLNYIHRPAGLEREVAWGLGAVLSSRLVDDFFRIQSGNTQVSATELRAMPLPSLEQLRALGAAVLAEGRGIGDPEVVGRLMRGAGLHG